MKRNIQAIICLFFLMVCCNSLFSQSQHCSNLASGPTVCAIDPNLTTAGFSPDYDSLPCVVDGVPYDTVIQFHVPATADGYTVSSIQILNIVNMPCGLCWASSSSTNSFGGNQTGCIRVEGTSYDEPNQYILYVYANVTVSVPVIGNVTEDDLNIDTVTGLQYYARVAVPGGACLPANTAAPIHYAENAQGSIPAPTINGNAVFCTGTNAVLNAASSSYYGYVWSTGAITSSISVNTAGTYTVTVFGDCASATASKTITSLPSPTDSIAPANAAVCNGSNVTLTATGGGTYVWSTGSTNPSIFVQPSNPTTYTVTVTASNGCTATASRTVNIGTTPTVTITPSTTINICGGVDTTLTANGSNGVTYAWSSGSHSDTAQVAPFTNTTYKVTVTNGSGCSATASKPVSVIPLNATITANGPTTLCGGGSVTLSATAGYTSYLWSDNETTPSITTSTPGTYSCVITNSSGCTLTSNSITVAIASNLIPVITASNTFNICPGGSTVLSAGIGYTTYSWSLGATSDSVIATPTSTHTYSVTVTQGGCQGTATATVNVSNFPVAVSITPQGPITTCNGSNITLSVDSTYATYHWSNGPTTDSIQVTTSGNYIITVTENNACSGTVSAQVTFVAPPMPVITPAGTQTICNGGSVTLDAGADYLTYLWSTGDTSQIINVVSANSYTVTVGETGCSGSAASPVVVVIASTPNPGITPTGTINICAGQITTLTADAGYSNYLWVNGDTTQAISADSTGIYSVTVTSNGCTGVSTQPTTVYVNAIPVATAAELGTASGFTELEAGPDYATYQWLVQQIPDSTYTLSATTQFDTVVCSSSPTYYSVIATQNGCSDTSANAVEVVCTGLSDIASLVSFTIQPNPAKDVLYVNYELSAATDVHLTVIDMTGQKVADIVNMNETTGLHKHYIAVGDFAPGIYLLNFMTESGSFNTKFVKQ